MPESDLHVPKGYRTYVANVGIRDETEDLVCIVSDVPCVVDGVFTQSTFAGPSVVLSRQAISNGTAQAILTTSKNANVATGPEGADDARRLVADLADAAGIDPTDVVIAATGVIGRRLPVDKILPHIRRLPSELGPADFEAAARGIMTTDKVAKIATARVGDASIVGIAKGVGMMEPNMATLIAYFCADAELDRAVLSPLFRRVMDRSYNCVSIDTDTSPSDTAVILTNGLAGPVDPDEFEQALAGVALALVRAIIGDGEGATKSMEVTVDHARSPEQARVVGKAIVNSPLVKTAIHGADPNWGRIAMAIGKCEDQVDVHPDKTVIRFAGIEVYPTRVTERTLDELARRLAEPHTVIRVSLNTGAHAATVWGTDLSAEYVRFNSEYSS